MQHTGLAMVSVVTPHNGSVYFEELRDGSGKIVEQGLVPSGGESAPLFLPIRYREPVMLGLIVLAAGLLAKKSRQ